MIRLAAAWSGGTGVTAEATCQAALLIADSYPLIGGADIRDLCCRPTGQLSSHTSPAGKAWGGSPVIVDSYPPDCAGFCPH